MNLGDMIIEMQDHGFEDSSPDTLTGFINDAYYDICSRQPWPFLEALATVNTVANQVTLDVPADFDKAIRLVIDSEAARLEPARADDIYSRFNGALTDTGLPVAYYFVGNEVRLYPIPDAAYTITLYYLKVPAALATNTDTPILPTKHHRAIVLGALVAAYRMEDDPGNADVFEAQFEKRLATMAEDVWKKQYDRPDHIYTLYENDTDPFNTWPWV